VHDPPPHDDSSINLERHVLRGLDDAQATLVALSKQPIPSPFCTPLTTPWMARSHLPPFCTCRSQSSWDRRLVDTAISVWIQQWPTALLCGEGLARRRQDGGGFRLLCIKAKCDIGSGCEAGRRRLGFWHRGAAVGSHIHLATADLARQVDLPVLRKELDLKWEMSVCKDGCYNRTFNVSGTR
jgi:hypothetical protein